MTIVKTKEPIHPATRNIILSVHSKDADVHELLGDIELQNGNIQTAENFYLRAINQDPKSVKHYLRYFKIQNTITKQIEILSDSFLSEKLKNRAVIANGILRQAINKRDVPSLDDSFVTSEQVKEYLAHMYYLFGLGELSKNTQNAVYLWTLSNDIDPSLSYYSVDLASIMYWKYSGTASALKILKQCQENTSARAHCFIAEGQLRRARLPQPGSFGDTILHLMKR